MRSKDKPRYFCVFKPPASDSALAARYSARDPSGKARCKAALQSELGLASNPDVPLFAVVSRLNAQKGLDPVLSALPVAYWVTGDTGMKQTTTAAWQSKTITVDELAVIVPVPENVLDDIDFRLKAGLIGSVGDARITKAGLTLVANRIDGILGPLKRGANA